MIVNLIFNILEAIAAIIVPVGAIYYIKNKFGAKLRNAFDGTAVYLIFYCLVYAVISTYLQVVVGIFDKIESDIWPVIINAALETICVAIGYLIWFKYAVKKQQDNGVGLMTGVGFSSLLLFISHAVPSVVNVVLTIVYMKNPQASVWVVFEENVSQIFNSTPQKIFFDLLEMISLFVFETAFATVFYRVVKCENRKMWLLLSMLLRISAYTVIRMTDFFHDTVIFFIFAAITLVLTGIAYSLVKPFQAKKED